MEFVGSVKTFNTVLTCLSNKDVAHPYPLQQAFPSAGQSRRQRSSAGVPLFVVNRKTPTLSHIQLAIPHKNLTPTKLTPPKMSGAGQGPNNPDPTATVSDAAGDQTKPLQPSNKPAAQLEEDDEFEDFPVEDWAKEEEVGAQGANTHLWEESWDDDDTSEDFSVQLK